MLSHSGIADAQRSGANLGDLATGLCRLACNPLSLRTAHLFVCNSPTDPAARDAMLCYTTLHLPHTLALSFS